MKTILLLLFLTLMISGIIYGQTPKLETGVSQTLAKWRSANYSDVRYKLNITLEKGAPLMTGEIEIRVKLTEQGAKNDLIWDWRTTQFANEDRPRQESSTKYKCGKRRTVSFEARTIKIKENAVHTPPARARNIFSRTNIILSSI